nr:uncharacterized protein LOC111505296 [Leptinotarsa decemlineata]
MATLPTDSRQPPDGHEFPDFIELHNETLNDKYFEETPSTSSDSSSEVPEEPQERVTVNFPKTSNLILCQSVSASNTELRSIMYDSSDDLKHESIPAPAPLHTRSQSLIDMSALTKQKNAKWNQLFEQRRKGLSKLKGLVIPESSEPDVLPCVDIPEIKSQNTQLSKAVPKLYSNFSVTESPPKNNTESMKPSIGILPWSSNSTSNLPKYSPAFKRKSLQLYPTSISKDENSECIINQEFPKYCDKPSSKVSKSNEDDLNPPKSLESISSPTRSDCSFDYVSSTRKYVKDSNELLQKSHHTNKLEDESDNDSAVSSSQSSYNSRYSPPPSPTRSCEMNLFGKKLDDDEKNIQNRLLKPSSVEAINRKNILASAKCRSGKDLKIGSPVIRRKQEETPECTEEKIANEMKTEYRVSESASSVADETIDVEKETVALKVVETKKIEETVPELRTVGGTNIPLNYTVNRHIVPINRNDLDFSIGRKYYSIFCWELAIVE